MRSRRLLVLLALLVFGRVAAAQQVADLEETSRVLQGLEARLSQLGFERFHIGGGAALSLAMHARYGTPPSWNDVDVRAFPRGRLTLARVERVAEALQRDGFEILPPGPIDFIVHRRGRPGQLFSQGYGLRLQKNGLRFDLPMLLNNAEIRRSGYNSAESLTIPIQPGEDLRAVIRRLGTGSPAEMVERGDLREARGNALAVLNGKVVLTNRHLLALEPELAALRYLRGVEKMMRFPPAVSAPDLVWLQQNLRRMMARAPAVKDPSYLPRVQEQAAALLATGGPKLHQAAKRMGLDLRALAAGKLGRAPRR